MIVWLVFAGLALVVSAALALPMLCRSKAASTRADFDLEVFRAQLAELESDHVRGLLGKAELAAARREIERRMLGAAPDAEAARTPEWAPPLLLLALDWLIGDPARRAIRPALAVAVLVPLASVWLYAVIGFPEAPDVPFAEREGPAGMPAEMDAAVAGLAARLEENPNDFEGGFMLGRSYGVMERYDDAAAAMAQAAALEPENIDALVAYGEALVFAADGLVTPLAALQFEIILALDPGNVAGQLYHGTAQLQAGDGTGAFATWSVLAVNSPPDAPWLPSVMQRLEVLADKLDLALPEVEIVTAPPDPSVEGMAAAAEMPPDEQAVQIETMVARLESRLAEEPGDAEGWKRLGRVKQVLGNLAASRAAYEKAVELLPEDLEALKNLAGVIDEAAGGEVLPDDAVALYARVLEIDPNAAEALWFLGLDAAQNDRKEEAKAYWRRLLARMPFGSEGYDMLSEQIDAL
jgi:cytochrome c-type biogenesis protein CcmH